MTLLIKKPLQSPYDGPVMLLTLIYVFSVVILIIRINHVIKQESIA